MSLMTEVLTSANEAERRGKNGPVGRGLAGEPGDVSSAPGSAVASADDLQRAAEPRPVPRVPRWRCSAFTCGSRAGNNAIINEGERSLGICPQAMFSSPPSLLLQMFPEPTSSPSPSLHFAPSRKGVFCKGKNTKCKGDIRERGLQRGIHHPSTIQGLKHLLSAPN